MMVQLRLKKVGSSNLPTDTNMAGPSIIGVIMGYLALMVDIIPLQLQVILSSMTIATNSTATGGGGIDFFLTIERIVFNQIPLFNINYFDNDGEYSVGTGTHEVVFQENAITKELRESISKMFIVCRILALILGLFVLIYIGIRMAVSTISSDKAKYKKMFVSWVESIVIIFIIPYIMVFTIYFGEFLTSVFYDLRCEIGGESFESTILSEILLGLFGCSGLKLAMYSIMYWILIYNHFKFFYLYLKRILMVGFLIMISPLITITYSIDKAGDGKAQAFGTWFSEFLMNVLVQPLHAIIYLVFMYTAGEIAKYAPILGLIFMMSLGTVEKTVKRLFNSKDLASLGALNEFRKGKK